VKRFETRSWSTAHRGLVAVHAAKGFPPFARLACEEPPIAELLEGLGLTVDTLPRGAVLGLVEVYDYVLLTDYDSGRIRHLGAEQLYHLGDWRPPLGAGTISRVEAALGDYSAGRYAWLAGALRPFRQPIADRGHQGLWTWTVPANFRDLEPEIAALLEAR
jgi:hypothetical protein